VLQWARDSAAGLGGHSDVQVHGAIRARADDELPVNAISGTPRRLITARCEDFVGFTGVDSASTASSRVIMPMSP